MSEINTSENYQQIKVIGKGSYGEVWLVKHKRDKKQYVLKKMDLQNASRKERRAAEQEAKLLSKLKHPNIVAYKDSFENNGYLFIAMGFCEGGDLYNRLKEQKGVPLEEKQVVEWFVQIAMALQYMHERNILHRDLKTQNIFLTKSKIIKVGDLGIARVLDSSSDMATTLIGTPYYMSPELFSNKPYNHKSDVWALGCCVYEMATLKHAFNAKDMNSLVYKILKGKIPQMPNQYSNDLLFLIKAMLHQNPAKRPSVNRLLRDPYIKKNIAIFLEGTKSRRPSTGGVRPTSSSGRPSSGKSRQIPCDHHDGSADTSVSSVSESQDSEIATLSKVDLTEEMPPQPPAPGMQDLNTIEEASSSKEHGSGGSSSQKQDVQQDISPEEEPRLRRRKKKSVKDKDVDSESIFDKPIKVEKPRPLPPPPVSSGTPSTPKKRPHRSVDESSSSSYTSVSISSSQENTPGMEDANRSRPNSSARARRRQKIKQDGSDTPTGPSEKPRLHPDLHRVRSTEDARDKKSRDKPISVRHRQPSVADEEESENSETEETPETNKKRSDKEMNNFISLLDTTLNLNKDDDKSEDEDETDARPVAPEPEMNIPRRKSEPAFGIGAETLGTSGRLMERINALRKDCMRGIGIEKMHKAYEILEDVEGENVEGRLMDLLGKDKFDVYAGKIWQLKFCEESAFGLV